MSSELIARAQLFASIEPGLTFWSREVFEIGPEAVVEKCRAGKYKYDVTDILGTNGEAVLERIENFGFQFVSPGDIVMPCNGFSVPAPSPAGCARPECRIPI